MILEVPDEYFTEEELKNTPGRFRRFLEEWASNDKFNFTTFENPGYDQIIALDHIEFYSLCSHHVLPFFGHVHLAYIPNDKVFCGISKLARVVDKFASRPQVQERLTQQIAEFIEKNLNAKGVIIVIEAKHMCMVMRGIKKQNSIMRTSDVRGVFRTDKKARDEFFSLINNNR